MSNQFDKSNLGRENNAFYGRYSSHLQRDDSIGDQMRVFRETMPDARRRPVPGPFPRIPDRGTGKTYCQIGLDEIFALVGAGQRCSDVIYVSDTSRLGRNLPDISEVSEIEISEIVKRYSRLGPRGKY